MKFFALILMGFLSFSAAAGEIVLLTSLKLANRNVRHLEKKFNKTFRNSGHELVIHHKADPKVLHQVMTSEKTEAVIWVSHAAGEHELQPGFKAEDIILDIWGNDVKNFFTLIPPNLKFIGLVGCQAQKIIDGFRARGNYVASPELQIMSFEKKVRLYNAFGKTLKVASEVISKATLGHVPLSSSSIEFNIERSSFEESPSLQAGWVEIGDRVLGFLDVNQTSVSGSVEESIFNKIARKNIKFYRSKSATSVPESMGKLDIRSPQNIGTWNLFARDGRPIGGSDQQLYVYKRP